jgi:predicted TIM-barrel fold metal-dependent hydrolase
MRKYRVISGDGHLETPLDFTTRVPVKFKDMVPRLEMRPNNVQVWVMDQWERPNIGNLQCGMRYNEYLQNTGQTYFNGDGSPRPGTGDAKQRLREQDQDGIDAEVLYPPIFGPALIRNMIKKDREAYLAIVQAYNNFLLREYCAVAPDRLIGCVLVPESGVEDAVAEMGRCAKLGARASCLAMWPNGGVDPIPDVDARYWAAVLDLDLKQTPHSNFGGPPQFEGHGTREMAVCGIGQGAPCAATIGRLILYVFDRFPTLKFYFAETQAAWLAHTLHNRLDECYLRWSHFYDLRLKKLPSEYWRDHCKFGFVMDRTVMKMRELIGTDLLMWGSDFPHLMSTFPDSREIIDDLFEDVPPMERQRVLLDNVCEFFDLDPNAEITPTP